MNLAQQFSNRVISSKRPISKYISPSKRKPTVDDHMWVKKKKKKLDPFDEGGWKEDQQRCNLSKIDPHENSENNRMVETKFVYGKNGGKQNSKGNSDLRKEVGSFHQGMNGESKNENSYGVDNLIHEFSSLSTQSIQTLRQKAILSRQENEQKYNAESEVALGIFDFFLAECLRPIAEEAIVRSYSNDLFDGLIYKEVLTLFEQKPDKEFAPLTNSQNSIAKQVFGYGDPSEEFINMFNIKMRRKDFKCLRASSWLTDEVINFYFKLMQNRCDSNPFFPKCQFMTTFFYLKLSTAGYNGVRRWTKNVDVFTKQKILIPVHLGAHWVCAVINLSKKRFEYYDSMGGRRKDILQNLQEYIEEEHLDKKGTTLDTSSWEYYMPGRQVPQQDNCNDCGVFTCQFANFLSQNFSLLFRQSDMPYFRRKIAVQICEGKVD